MTRLLRQRAALFISGLALGLSAALALAAPPVIDRVPDNAMLVALIPSPDSLQKHIGDLGTAIEFPIPVPPATQMLAMVGINAGVDTSKAVAIVVLAPPPPPPPPAAADAAKGDSGKGDAGKTDTKAAQAMKSAFDHPEDRAIILLPVTNYADFLNNFNTKPAGAGQIDSINMPSGQAGFAKDLGSGYIAISDKKALLESLSGKPGESTLKAKLGKAGESLTDASDISLVINFDPIRPWLPTAVAEMKAKMKEQAASMGGGGAEHGAQMEAHTQAVAWFIESVANDASAAVAGVRISSQGVAMDQCASFKTGSYMGKAFATGGSPNALLAKLPAQDFILAGAIDTAVPAFRQFLVDIVAKGTPADMPPESAKALTDAITTIDGHAGVIGFPKGGIMAGLLTSAVSFHKAKDPAAAIATIRKGLEVMEHQPAAGGVSFKSTYTEGGAKVGDKPVDVWDVKLAADGEGNQMVGMGLQWMFGRNDGFGGYIAKTADGLYRTYSKNAELMGKALAQSAPADSLAGNKLISQVADRMPPNRIAEGYIGTRSLLEALAPFIAMTGVPVPMDKIPEQLPPIGMALSADSGAARCTVFLPTPVIKAGVQIGTAFADQMHGGGEEAPGDHKEGKTGTGQPKF